MRLQEEPAFPFDVEVPAGSRWPDGSTEEKLTRHVAFGMTLRDWFATHAPTDIPDWFPWPQEPAIVNVADRWSIAQADPRWKTLSLENRGRLHDWLRDGCYDLDGAIAAIGHDVEDKHRKLRAQADEVANERQRRRYIGWRWTYADMMLGNTAPRAVDADRMRLALSSIALAENDSITAAPDKVRDMARIARMALEGQP